jgi:SusD family.
MKVKCKICWQLPLLAGAVLAVTSCDSYLDEPPSKGGGVPITTIDQLSGLLSRNDSFQEEDNAAQIFASDSYEVSPELYNANPSDFDPNVLSTSLWEVPNLETDADNLSMWSYEFQKVFNANIVLMSVGKVSGTQEQKEQISADAHLIRAYSYFTLVNTYCLPYCDKNKKELGLPLKRSTSYEENIARTTLEDTYAFIEADIKEALKAKASATLRETWSGNIAAANGLAARFYLTKGDYKEALKHANAALADYSELVDYNSDMSTVTYSTTINGSSDDPQEVDIVYPYLYNVSSSSRSWFLIAKYKGNYYHRWLYNNTGWYVPSAKLLSLYDQTYDLRYKYHIVQNYSYEMGMDDPAYSYPGYCGWSSGYVIESAPCSAEMLLIKAECIARDPQLGTIADAMAVVNTLRVKRYSTTAPASVVNLTAASKEDAVKLILEERQREMPFTQRWFDIRRCNSNEVSFDDITLTKSFYPILKTGPLKNDPVKEYKLEPNSRRYAIPIPKDDITASRGVLKQNTY